MTALEIAQKLNDMPFFSLGTVGDELFRDFNTLKKTLEERGENDHHQLNKGNVTGIWYLSGLKYEEGNPQLLVRSSIKKGTYERILLGSEIWDFVKQDVTFDYDADLLMGDGMIIGTQKELCEEILAGRVYTIFDANRQ